MWKFNRRLIVVCCASPLQKYFIGNLFEFQMMDILVLKLGGCLLSLLRTIAHAERSSSEFNHDNGSPFSCDNGK